MYYNLFLVCGGFYQENRRVQLRPWLDWNSKVGLFPHLSHLSPPEGHLFQRSWRHRRPVYASFHVFTHCQMCAKMSGCGEFGRFRCCSAHRGEGLWRGGGRVVSSVWQGAAAAAQSGKMARRCSRATSQQTPVRRPTAAAILMCFCLLPSAAQAGLYTASDQITLLTRDNVESVLVNSTAAAVVEFYASWCGHCISFSPVYKSLARDISG